MMEDGSHLHELLEALEAGVLSLERGQGSDPAAAIHRLFQSAHNLKSGLAMAGLERASKLFHGLEDGLDEMRRGRLAWSASWADAVLEAVDRVRRCLEVGEDGELDPVFLAPAAAPLQRSTPSTSGGQGAFRIEKLFLPGLSREEYEGHLILEDIASVGTLESVTPTWEAYSKATEALVVRYVFHSTQTLTQLADLFFDPLIPLTDPEQTLLPPRYRLLVVEDDRLTAKLLERALRSYGDVVVAFDGADGLAAFRRAFDEGQRFDIVVLDLELPEVNGHGVLEGLRDYEEGHGVLGLDRCLVFMNTSNSDLKKVKASFKLQADRYFIKPLSTEQIAKTLEETLAWLQTRRRGTE